MLINVLARNNPNRGIKFSWAHHGDGFVPVPKADNSNVKDRDDYRETMQKSGDNSAPVEKGRKPCRVFTQG